MKQPFEIEAPQINAQTFVDYLRKGEYYQAINFYSFTLAKYIALPAKIIKGRELSSDIMQQALIYELCQTDLNRDDIAALDFMDKCFVYYGLMGERALGTAIFSASASAAVHLKEAAKSAGRNDELAAISKEITHIDDVDAISGEISHIDNDDVPKNPYLSFNLFTKEMYDLVPPPQVDVGDYKSEVLIRTLPAHLMDLDEITFNSVVGDLKKLEQAENEDLEKANIEKRVSFSELIDFAINKRAERAAQTRTKIVEIATPILLGVGGAAIGAGVGSLIFPVVGTAIGAVLGGAIVGGGGAALGLSVVGLVELFKKNPARGTTLTTAGGIGVGAAVGALLGTLVFPGIGTGIGAAIGAGVGAAVSFTGLGLYHLWQKHRITGTALTTAGSAGLGAGVGALLGTVAFPGIGTGIGAAIGAGIGASIGCTGTGIYNAVTKRPLIGTGLIGIGTAGIGAGIGAAIGTAFFPGPGTAIGAAIGAAIPLAAASIAVGVQLFKTWRANRKADAPAVIRPVNNEIYEDPADGHKGPRPDSTNKVGAEAGVGTNPILIQSKPESPALLVGKLGVTHASSYPAPTLNQAATEVKGVVGSAPTRRLEPYDKSAPRSIPSRPNTQYDYGESTSYSDDRSDEESNPDYSRSYGSSSNS
ncbi:Uncharacterised protein [Legionella beliardensis]|uniref:Lpg0393-like VPS9-like domain-containing protein n=1 Tax=Legionella beliardensis TaxID=91822 RepID=A0A378HY03_9GAMM|nr:hypothetical protein [Legionella beliardensis]STX27692.1 Uncharacterised protein [Legionella beliardensis]